MASPFLVVAFLFITAGIGLPREVTRQTPPSEPPTAPQPITEGFGVGAYRLQPGIYHPTLLRRVEPSLTAWAALEVGAMRACRGLARTDAPARAPPATLRPP